MDNEQKELPEADLVKVVEWIFEIVTSRVIRLQRGHCLRRPTLADIARTVDQLSQTHPQPVEAILFFFACYTSFACILEEGHRE